MYKFISSFVEPSEPPPASPYSNSVGTPSATVLTISALPTSSAVAVGRKTFKSSFKAQNVVRAIGGDTRALLFRYWRIRMFPRERE